MKKYLLILAYALLLFLFQTAAAKVWPESPYLIPHLSLLLVIAVALTSSLTQSLGLAFFLGFLQELFSGQFFGAQIVALTLTAVMIYFLTRNFTAQDLALPTAVFLVILSSLLEGFWIFLYDQIVSIAGMGSSVPLSVFYSSKIIWVVLVNLLFFQPVSSVFKLFPQ